MNTSTISPRLSRRPLAASMPFMPSICMSRKTMSNRFPDVTIHSHFTHMRKNSRQSRLPFLHQPAYMFPDRFLVIHNCNIQNPSPQIHIGIHFLYRQKFPVFRADGTKRPLFGNERQKRSTEFRTDHCWNFPKHISFKRKIRIIQSKQRYAGLIPVLSESRKMRQGYGYLKPSKNNCVFYSFYFKFQKV